MELSKCPTHVGDPGRGDVHGIRQESLHQQFQRENGHTMLGSVTVVEKVLDTRDEGSNAQVRTRGLASDESATGTT